jgi:hypothetical protein
MKRILIIGAACIGAIAVGYYIFTVKQQVEEKFDILDEQLAILDSSRATEEAIDSMHMLFILRQEKSLFVGSEQTDSMKLICSMEIKTINPKSFEYTLDFMNDSKKFKTVKGKALRATSYHDNFQIKDAHADKKISAHKFIDLRHGLAIEISNEDLSSSIVRIKKFMDSDKELTPVMFYK